MALNSVTFLTFLAIVIFVYYIVPKRFQWFVLLVASYGFYLSSGIPQVAYIISSTLFTYGAGRWMQKIRNDFQNKLTTLGNEATKEQKQEMKKGVTRRIRTIQVLTVLVCLGVLAYVKYLNFFIGNLNDLFGFFKWDVKMPLVNVLVPLGLSYYTFNSIGYIIDIGRGKQEAEKHLGKYALFVSFFPSIVQGPLNRFCDLGEQLKQPHKISYENLKYGAQLILFGLFKKMVIADRVSAITMNVFVPSTSAYNGGQILFGVLAYSLQIYCDFSGGTDITRGAAQMMGIDLPLNFERPFFATSMADFWRRWHMSLGAWMREYVFYPVMLCKPVSKLSKTMRQRHGAYWGKMVPSVAAPMVVFFLIGIWHGLTWQYIVNGLYNALLISSSVAMTPVFQKMIKITKVDPNTFSFRLFQMLRTFVLLCISRIIVKAPSLHDAGRMIKSIFTNFDIGFITGMDGQMFKMGLSLKEIVLIMICVLALLVIGILQENGVKIRETLAKQNVVFRWAIMYLLIFAIIIFGMYGPGYDADAFIYGGF